MTRTKATPMPNTRGLHPKARRLIEAAHRDAADFKAEHALRVLRGLETLRRAADRRGDPDAAFATIGELGDLVNGLDRHQVGRRVPELLADGFVIRGPRRRCKVAGSLQYTHAITGFGRRQLIRGGRR